MISESPDYFFTLLSPEFFETIESYRPSREYLDIVEQHLGPEWRYQPGGFWTMVAPPGLVPRIQGWKIHVAATLETAMTTLRRLAPLLVAEQTSFKFCADSNMLSLSLNKNWPRTGSGKFMTIYPRDDEHFILLIERCAEATCDLDGPFILSDRPYKASRTVFYRYGEHTGVDAVDSFGRRTPWIVAPSGEWVSDERKPYFSLPPWVTDPFPGEETLSPPGKDGVLLRGRYNVTSAMKFSNCGGVYSADDLQSGRSVVIHEARPRLITRDGYDPQKVLDKEARILQELSGSGYLAGFVDLFQEWEHVFLVQERIDAESLWGYAMNLMYAADVTPASYCASLITTIREMVEGLQAIHSRRIILRDLSRNNVMFTSDGRVKFIDLEFAYELDRTEPLVRGWTQGYASQEQLRHEQPTFADDYYALGVLVLDMIAFTAPGYSLNRAGLLSSFRMTLDDLRLPAAFLEIATGLTQEDRELRWSLDRVLARLDTIRPPTDSTPLFPSRIVTPVIPTRDELGAEARDTVDGIARFVHSVSDFERHDRLWPASGELFQSNPANVQFGAAGVIAFLVRATRERPERAIDWMLDHLRVKKCPPGLYTGLAGVALVLLESGRTEAAEDTLLLSTRMDEVLADPGLYYGASGWGLANLHFWHSIGRDVYLANSLAVGDHLLRTVSKDETGLHWEFRGFTGLGLGHGQSGIATFLLHLYAACRDERFLGAACGAIDFEIANRYDMENGAVLWFPEVGASPGAPKSPHMRHGSAGVGSAVLRCYVLTGEAKYRAFAERCADTVANRQTNKLWQDYGLAGYGEFQLDMYRFLGDPRYLSLAHHIAEAILPHRIVRPEGIAFLGSDMLRMSCDFGMGSAGIGLFLHRLLNPDTPRFLFLDEIIETASVLSRANTIREVGGDVRKVAI